MMDTHLLNPLTSDKQQLYEIFNKISEENTILFLGAGASVTDKEYLSKQIIDYYQDKIGKSFEIENITELLDVLSETSWFSRSDFDNYVYELLSRLKPTEIHKTILSIKWRQIITTNFDYLIEKADLDLKEGSKNIFEIYPVRNVKEYNHFLDRNQVKYIKINGCISDKSKYPFAFSTQDFKRLKMFYRIVLNNLKSVSDKISFLSVGYSFSDAFAKQLLNEFDQYDFRGKRTLWSVDPFPNLHKLDFYKKQHIKIIKCTVSEFFEEYKKWEEEHFDQKLKITKGPLFTSSSNSMINVGSKLSYNLKGVVEQLNNHYRGKGITEEKYFRGEEPNYTVIENGYDVIRRKKIDEVKVEIGNIASKTHSLIPIIFLTGNFGTGKTTFIYRLIHEILQNRSEDTTAFEIIDIDGLRKENLKDLLEIVKSKNIILYCNNVEIDSVYKSIIDIRTFLSSMQLPEINIYFLLSIRENILELHKIKRTTKSTFSINIDSKLDRNEIDELLEKLRSNGLLDYRDSLEKSRLISKIEKDFDSDSFITLLDIVTEGKHIDNLREAYYELSKPCKNAFVYTALIHRYNLLVPSSILRNLVSSDWEDFRVKVINVEGKGILIQEDRPQSKGIDPDLYFRTKHPLIADKLIKEIHSKEDKRFSLYKEIVESITPGSRTGRFLINLLKSMRNANEFNDTRINTLFDLGYKVFKDDPYFLLQYSINLQGRGSRQDLEAALDRIKYAETLLEYRNDKFIHRKGVLYYRLAQIAYKQEKSELNVTLKYLNEAKDWLLLKQQLDPSSSFSYWDLLDLHIWELQKINFSPDEEIRKRIFIEDYFELALNSVSENTDRLIELQEKYEDFFQKEEDGKTYLQRLHEMYDDFKTRPLACVLLYNYYVKTNNGTKKREIFQEIESYKEDDDIAKFLFKMYGRELNYANTRVKFYSLARKMDWYEEQNPLRYNYYYYVAECYNMQMQSASDYLRKINEEYHYLNPEYKRFWLESDSNERRIFEGVVQRSKRGFKIFKCSEFSREIWFTKGGLEKVNFGDKCRVNLIFFLNGLKAVLIK